MAGEFQDEMLRDVRLQSLSRALTQAGEQEARAEAAEAKLKALQEAVQLAAYGMDRHWVELLRDALAKSKE